jgi:hypothetical protein
MNSDRYEDQGEDDFVTAVPSRWVKLPGTHIEIQLDHIATVLFRRGAPRITARIHGQTVENVELPGDIAGDTAGDPAALPVGTGHECPLPVDAPIGARFTCPDGACRTAWKARRGDWVRA